MWTPGDTVIWKENFRNRIWHAHAAIVVKDSPEEIALVFLPGSEGMGPAGWVDGKITGFRPWEFIDEPWKLKCYSWHTFRALFVLEPQKYYTTVYYWNAGSNQFLRYYINFQTPFTRSHSGIDTRDLELDLIVNPDLSYRWKDQNEFQKGIQSGVILPEWIHEIESAKEEIFGKLIKSQYPFDGSWLSWMPDPAWIPPTLPDNWDKM